MSAGGSGSGFDWVLSWRLRQVLTLQDVAKGFIAFIPEAAKERLHSSTSSLSWCMSGHTLHVDSR